MTFLKPELKESYRWYLLLQCWCWWLQCFILDHRTITKKASFYLSMHRMVKSHFIQGDQIELPKVGQNCSKLIMIFWKHKVLKRNGNVLGFFWFKPIHYIFTWRGFVVSVLKFDKWLDGGVLAFHIELSCSSFGTFLPLRLFWLLLKNWTMF